MRSNLFVVAAFSLVSLAQVQGYCQPGEPCWPSHDQIEAFVSSLTSEGDEECLKDVPTFTSADKQGDPISNEWYEDAPDILTPYILLNLKNHVAGGLAYFVVLARNESDISKAVLFATEHDIAISVMSTGHEFQDRNAGPGPNSLLIRTTCLRNVELNLDPENRFGHADGVARLGAGLTWGTSKLKMKGVQEQARDVGRMVVSGHAPNVGIVGWSLGGGHGQLVPMHGSGVDQMLEVELVSADGSFIVANAEGTRMRSADGLQHHFTENADLFWALRGGGGSTWGVIYAITVKLHAPRNGCSKGCYFDRTKIWVNRFDADDAKMAVDLLHSFLLWSSQASRYWSSYANLVVVGEGTYGFVVNALYIGKAEDDDGDFNNFDEWFKTAYPDNLVESSETVYDTFFDKLLSQDSSAETVFTSIQWFNMLSVLVNETMANEYDVAKSLVDNWVPRCYRQSTPCTSMLQFVRCLPYTYYEAVGKQDDTSLSDVFKSARMHIYIGDVISLEGDLTFEEKSEFIHETLAPIMYSVGEGSYFSESEYTMSDWQTRFWGNEKYEKLTSVKETWDPTKVFGCRHCIGDGIEKTAIGPRTMPPWRK